MTKIILACDESGAKGYADREESYPGEIGVFAGILVPDECSSAAAPKFMEIYDRYKPATGKLHIADLADDMQGGLRRDVYEAIQAFNLPCFWYAIHVAGLHAWQKSNDAISQRAKDSLQERRNGHQPRVKRGSPRSDTASMHVELFSGLYGHLIAFLQERRRKEVDIEIRTDQIDNPIIKDFEAVAKELLSDDPVVENVKGFDTVTRQLVEGVIKVEVVLPPEMRVEIVVRSLSINPVGEGDGFVLAADVLANSLHYLFKNRKDGERYDALNCPDAVLGHPLARYLDAFVEWGEGDLVGDRLYKHPRAPKI